MHVMQKKILDLAQKQDLAKVSLRSITRTLGEKHPQKIKHHLAQLENKGFIKIGNYKNQLSIQPVKQEKNSLVTIPIVGSANCGEATMFAEEQIQGYLRISPSLLDVHPKNLFAIKAVGNSMNRARVGKNEKPIKDGDLVLVKGSGLKPKQGAYVLSVIDGCANIKRFFYQKTDNRIALLSESTEDYPPIYIDLKSMENFLCNGTVVQVI